MHPSTPKSKFLNFLPPFLYCNLRFEHYEILTISNIKRADLKIETELMSKKWFDYRIMHPLMATYYFFHLYTEAYKNFWRQNINYEQADFVKPMRKYVDFLDSTQERNTIWRLRQMVDARGMRYEFFFTSAMKHLHKMIFNGRIMPPRPSMLKSEELFEKVYADWLAISESVTQYACSPYFNVANYSNSVVQRDYEDYLIKQIKSKRLPQYALSYCLYEKECLRIERVISEFSLDVVQEAINEAKFI